MAYTIRIPTEQACFERHTRPDGRIYPPVNMDTVIGSLHALVTMHYQVGDWRVVNHHYDTHKKLYKQIEMRRIRLKPGTGRPYCGQHAGPCVRPRRGPLPKSTCLEAADWIGLHNMINQLLDQHFVKADIETRAFDVFRVKGLINRFLIRTQELGGRKRFDYVDGNASNKKHTPIYAPHYLFNPGTPSQFGDGPYDSASDLVELSEPTKVWTERDVDEATAELSRQR